MSDLEKKLRETKELIPEPPKSLDAKLEARLNDSIKPLKRRYRLTYALTTIALVGVTIGVLALVFVGQKNEFNNLVHNVPQSKSLMKLDEDVVSRTASNSVEKLAPYIESDKNEDFVLSPATYTLAIAGLSAVSDNFNNDAFGLINPENDVKTLLEAWNFKTKNGSDYANFKSAILHQQVGPTYAFNKEKQKEVSKGYISTMVSTLDNYQSDATKFFKMKMDLNLKVPDLNLTQDGTVTYGVLKMQDYIVNGLDHEKKPYYLNGVESQKDSFVFATKGHPEAFPYYKGSNYEVFKVRISFTHLLIVLPNVGASLSDVNVSEAYTNFISENKYRAAYGYIPFFHNKVEGQNLVKTLDGVVSLNEVYMSKLLEDDVVNDLMIDSIIQSNDFEFNKYGVSGESITAIPTVGKSAPADEKPLDLSVNRPFYAFSLKDDFPLFINKVTNPGK